MKIITIWESRSHHYAEDDTKTVLEYGWSLANGSEGRVSSNELAGRSPEEACIEDTGLDLNSHPRVEWVSAD